MKSPVSARSLTAILVCGLLLAGCELLGFPSGGGIPDDLTASVGDPFEIEIGQTAVLDDANAEVRFVDLPEDSRCPTNLVCVWSGRVRADFVLVLPDGIHPFTFDGYVGGKADGPKLSLQVAGFNIVLKALAPYPVYDSDSGRSTSGRRATLVVTVADGG